MSITDGRWYSTVLGNNRVPVVNRALMWSRVDRNHDEYPMEDELVWTTDLKTVRKGIWRWGGATIPLEEGKWEDEEGNPIVVLQWTSLAESPNGPPAVPPPPRPISEIIAEQSLYNPLEENEEEQADWWKDWGEDAR